MPGPDICPVDAAQTEMTGRHYSRGRRHNRPTIPGDLDAVLTDCASDSISRTVTPVTLPVGYEPPHILPSRPFSDSVAAIELFIAR
jgi:hypothetical protein